MDRRGRDRRCLGGAVIAVSADRGAIITRWDDVLFMDESTLADTTKNIRGGIPILFPSPGKLENDRWSRDGCSGSMKQHGFARNLPWKATGSHAYRLESDEATRAQFPWDFTFDMTYVLDGSTLRLEHRITNRSKTSMPFGVGFIPISRCATRRMRGSRPERRARSTT